MYFTSMVLQMYLVLEIPKTAYIFYIGNNKYSDSYAMLVYISIIRLSISDVRCRIEEISFQTAF